jgi:4-diphosphocytidyl-2-C-methyl-D-erythritol kinase
MIRSWLAPAKVNLSLGVGAARPDGRHLLDSLVVFTRRVGDQLVFERHGDFSLAVEGPFAQGLSSHGDNLVLQAARLLRTHTGSTAGASIRLVKNLPVASGIGGGSADAAATLIGLNELWGAGLLRSDLAQLGAELGADVPACVMGKPLRMTGTGETTHAVGPVARLGIVLVNPLKPCPTGPVYQAFDAIGPSGPLRIDPMPDLDTPERLMAYLASHPNDLEAAAISLVPDIARVLSAISNSPNVLLARMSGSGATCFGLYENLQRAEAAAVTIQNQLAIQPIWVEADEINCP